MITDAEVERALDYLRDNAVADAQARANAEYLREWIRTERARLVTTNAELSNAAATAIAECHPDYLRALGAWRAAVEEDYRRRFLRAAAETKLDCWRTMSSNERAQRI